jgi:hypothetical protein
MTDRELLELAAKAVGNGAQWDCEERGMMILTPDKRDVCTWNPLTDNDDAFRLAIDMCLPLDLEDFSAQVYPLDIYEDYGTDKYEAVRRLIVRAAAEIGKRQQ